MALQRWMVAGEDPLGKIAPKTSFRLGSALLIVALTFGPSAGKLPSEKEKWTRYDSPHFTAFSRTFEGETREVLEWLELLRSVLAQITPDLKAGRTQVGSPLPTHVYLFPNAESFKLFRPYEGVAGFFSTRPDGNALAVETGHADPLSIVRHEYLHFVLQNNFPRLPLWLNEGLAEFFGTMRLEGNQVLVGEPVVDYIFLLKKQKLMGVTEILAVTPDSPIYRDRKQAPRFYASSWLLVHYLTAGSPDLQTQLGVFLDMLRSEEDPDAAFKKAFQVTPEELDERIRAYRQRIANVFPYLRFSFSDLKHACDITKRPMARPEVLAWLGRLLTDPEMGHPVEAKEHLAAALTLDPQSGPALLGMGVLEIGARRNAEALSFFRQAASADSRDYVAPFLVARLLMMSAAEGTEGGEIDSNLNEAAGFLRRSLEIQPFHAEARKMLDSLEDREAQRIFQKGWSQATNGKDGEEGLRLLQEAVERAKSPSLKQALAENLEKIKNPPPAPEGQVASEKEVQPPLTSPSGSLAEDEGEGRIVREAINQATELESRGEGTKAIALLEETAQKVTDEFFQARLQYVLRTIRTAEYNRLVGVFNAAIKKYNNGDFAGALPFFEDVAARATDETMKQKAQKLAAQCKAHLH